MNARRWLWTLAFAVSAVVRSEAATRMQLQVDFNDRVNAVYHLACLGGSIGCTTSVFERFWKERLGWTTADQEAFDAWRDTMTQVKDAAPPGPPSPLLANTFRLHPELSARAAVIVAAIEAGSVRDLRRRSGDRLDPERAARLKAAVDHVERRIRPWLERTRTAAMARRLGQVQEAARRHKLTDTAEQMASFLQSDMPEQKVHVHVIAAPEPQSEDYSATVFGNHFVFEVVDKVTADDIVSVATHELTHYLYDRAPVEKHLALMTQFVDSGATSAPGLYTFLNEAVAIAAQALHRQSGAPADGVDAYKHPYIAPLGEATVPLVREAVAAKATLFQGFAPRYIAAGSAALKEKLRQPQFVLAQVGLLVADGSDALKSAYSERMFPQAAVQFREEHELDEHPELNVVHISRYDGMRLAEGIPDLAALKQRRGFAYAMPRGRVARTYLLVGRDDAAIVEVITKLAAMEELSGLGLLVALE